MSDLNRLLDVQAHDTHADQLRHRRATLPEREQLAAADAELARLGQERARVDGERAELAREQKRREDEIASFDERIASVDRTLYGGTVTNPRELQALQDDLGSMQRRRSAIEDEVLDLMEQIEPLQAEVERLDATGGDVTKRRATVADQLAAAEAEIDAELAEVDAARAAAVDGIAPALITEYERLRRNLGGVGVAKLSGNRCEGCHLTLSAIEIDRIHRAPVDELIHCEDCGRLLVR